MTHPIDGAKNYVSGMLQAMPKEQGLLLSRKTLTLLTQPDPRVTALVEAAQEALSWMGQSDVTAELEAALAPFLKDNQDAN